jgi:hypothetical protein
MDRASIDSRLARELEQCVAFQCSHGITPANLKTFLVTPFAVTVDPDDLESRPREMWVVLQERRHPTEGYVIAYDSETQDWAVAEHVDGAMYRAVIASPTLAGALEGM